MATPQTATGVIQVGQSFYVLGIKDANGNYAQAQTNFTQTPSGLIVPAPADAAGNPIHAGQSTAPSFSANTGAISSSNVATSLSIALGSLSMGNGLFDAKQATIRILNSGTSQTVTGLTLTLEDSVGGTQIPITYSVSSLTVASGGTYTWTVPLTSGIATNATLAVIFGAAPVAGEVYAAATFQSAGAPVTTLTGTVPPLELITPKLLATIPYTQFTAASSSIYPYYLSSLTRSARERTFIIYNTMNQPLTSNALAFYDSVLGITGQPGIAQTAVFTAAGSNAVSTVTSESASASSQGLVASHVDSFQAVLGIGATLPTSGNVLIYVSELL